MRIRPILAFLGVLGLVLSACGPATQATPTARPTVPPTAVPAPTATATPSGGVPQSATPTPKPTVAPTPKSTVEGEPRRGGVLRIGSREEPGFWEQMRNTAGTTSARIHSNVVFNMLAVTPNTPQTGCSVASRPDAADGWKWTDDRTLEIKLHPGIKLQNKAPVNGREMTAEDVAWSLQRLKTLQTRISEFSSHITEIKAVDRYTVTMRLDIPLPGLTHTFLASPYGMGLLAKEAGDYSRDPTWGDWLEPEKSYIGSGPFMFARRSLGVKVVYEKNPNYWKPGLPYLDGLEVRIIPDPSTQLAALVSGQLDAVHWNVPLSVVETVQQNIPSLNVIQGCLSWGHQVLWLRTDKPPYNDVRVRRAFSMSMDREVLLQKLLRGKGILAAALPAVHPLYIKIEDLPPETQRYAKYNPDEARRLLAEAGYSKGLEVTYEGYLGDPRYRVEVSEAMMGMLEKIGVKVNQKWYGQRAEWTAKGLSGNYEGIAGATSGADDPYIWLGVFHSKYGPETNRSHARDPQLDSLIDAFVSTLDETKRKELAKQIQVRLVEQVYWIVPPAPLEFGLAQRWVKAFGPFPHQVFLGNAVEIAWLAK